MSVENVSTTASSPWVVPQWINGKEEKTPDTFPVIDPSTGKECWRSSSASREDALRAVSSASSAFQSWSKTKPALRSKILFRAVDIIEEFSSEYAFYMETEMGAERNVAKGVVLPLAVQLLRDIASRAACLTEGSIPVCGQEGRSGIVVKVPYGVTLGIVPWNAPYVFGIRSAATAIATGNSVVLKASELSPRCYWAIGKAFHDAGLPHGVLNIITCPPERAAEIVDCMIEHPAVKKVNFTGSTSTGRKIASICGKNLKPCLMELGGKNSAIVLDDADVSKAVESCIVGSFLNAGQICMGTDRIIVQDGIAPKFLEALREALEGSVKSGTSCPRVVSSSSKARLLELVSDAISAGASTLSGGGGTQPAEGASFIPSILQGANKQTRLWREETFGPVAAIQVVTTVEEAVEAANDTEYGLSAAVFTEDLRKGLSVAKQLEAGAVHINSMTIHDEPALPFGGVKASGWGRFNAQEGMDEFLVTKSITWDN